MEDVVGGRLTARGQTEQALRLHGEERRELVERQVRGQPGDAASPEREPDREAEQTEVVVLSRQRRARYAHAICGSGAQSVKHA
jgi:hypothetical protein